jgi:hypothetical protein
LHTSATWASGTTTKAAVPGSVVLPLELLVLEELVLLVELVLLLDPLSQPPLELVLPLEVLELLEDPPSHALSISAKAMVPTHNHGRFFIPSSPLIVALG